MENEEALHQELVARVEKLEVVAILAQRLIHHLSRLIDPEGREWNDYFTRRFKEARSTLQEAEKLLIAAVGKKTTEPFLLYCQIGTVCARMDDAKGMKAAQDEARAILKTMQAPNLEKHLQQTLSWAQWHLQHYIGL